jgi:DNA-binding GntR family transcriptional regulator
MFPPQAPRTDLAEALAALNAGGPDAHRTLADRAFALLHEAIVGGHLAPGQRLPIEDVAAALGTSPMPVREALRRLDAVGLVEHIAHRGARVTQLSIEDLVEVYEGRLALEGVAIARAARERTDADIATARGALDALDRAARRNASRVWSAHTEYHFALYQAAHSSWLLRLIKPLWESSERYRVSIARRRLDMRHQEHQELLTAIEQREGERAARLLHDHLATTANDLAALIGHEAPFAVSERAHPAEAKAAVSRA